MSNLCIRCGKERIVVKTWNEEIQTERRMTVITHTLTSCPDETCQKAVDKEVDMLRQKNEERRVEKANKEIAEKEARVKRAEAAVAKSGKKR